MPTNLLTPTLVSSDGLRSAFGHGALAEQFLRCYLEPDMTVLLPIEQLIEVLNLTAGQVTPIPHLPPWVVGVYNWRGEILWILDLGHLLGLIPWYEQTTYQAAYSVAILRLHTSDPEAGQRLTLGLIVSQVQDIEWCDPDHIQSPPASAVTPELAPFLRGYWLKQSSEFGVSHSGTLRPSEAMSKAIRSAEFDTRSFAAHKEGEGLEGGAVRDGSRGEVEILACLDGNAIFAAMPQA